MHRRDTNPSGGAGWRCARGRLPAGVRRERRSAQPARRDGFAGDANALRAAHERREPGRHRGCAVRGRGDHARHLRQPLVLEDRDQPLALPLCCQAAPIVAGKLRGADLARDLVGRVRELLGTRYTAITAVARGGNATLFGAYDQQGQQVAIKVLHPELAVSVAADRFLREIRYASQLHHPHIAPLIDSGESDYLLWFVMPYVAGEPPFSAASAAAVLDMQQHAPPPDLRKLRRDVPRALSDTVMKSLSKAREARWQTAFDMRQALLPYAAAMS